VVFFRKLQHVDGLIGYNIPARDLLSYSNDSEMDIKSIGKGFQPLLGSPYSVE
jgi:hypothetical protein